MDGNFIMPKTIEELIKECINDPTPIEDRLEGNYEIGINNEFGSRHFKDSNRPIIQIAAARIIRELRGRIKELEDDCRYYEKGYERYRPGGYLN